MPPKRTIETPQAPDDPPTPSNAPQDDQDNDVPSLAEAITLMTAELKNREPKRSKIKAKEPDTFDGSDPKKLNNFILLCSLYFRSNPAYDDDESKVNFALSYLRGTALEYFEPALLVLDGAPEWLDDWSVFTQTLRTQFGPLDPTADAEDSLDNLKMMRDNQRILKYNVDFNRLAIQTGWTDGVLRHRYYSGLAERIKDVMGNQVKPNTLDDLKTLAHSIDARHWERIREKSRTEKSQSSSKSDNKTSKSNNKSDNNNNNKPDKSSNSGKNNASSSKTNNNNSNNNNKTSKPSASGSSIADKLGKDGKLTSDERQRRFDNNLCLYCGGTGHKTADCKKASASKTKARAAKVPEETADSPKKE